MQKFIMQSQEQALVAERVIPANKVTGDQYYFILPDLKEIQYARLDPSRQRERYPFKKIFKF